MKNKVTQKYLICQVVTKCTTVDIKHHLNIYSADLSAVICQPIQGNLCKNRSRVSIDMSF